MVILRGFGNRSLLVTSWFKENDCNIDKTQSSETPKNREQIRLKIVGFYP